MAQKEHIRETLSGLPTLEHLVERVEAGWKLVAIEWERQASAAPIEIREKHVLEEIPYGLRVSDDWPMSYLRAEATPGTHPPRGRTGPTWCKG